MRRVVGTVLERTMVYFDREIYIHKLCIAS